MIKKKLKLDKNQSENNKKSVNLYICGKRKEQNSSFLDTNIS